MRVDADGARGLCIHALSGRHCHMRMCTWGRVTVGAPEISHGRVSVMAVAFPAFPQSPALGSSSKASRTWHSAHFHMVR